MRIKRLCILMIMLMLFGIGFSRVSAYSEYTLDMPTVSGVQDLDNETIISLAKQGILIRDKSISIEENVFESGELIIIQTKITRLVGVSEESGTLYNSYSVVLHNEMYNQNMFPVGVMEAYIGYDTIVFGYIPHFKVTSFGHRLISYESLFGSPVTITSTAVQNGIGTLNGTNYVVRTDRSLELVTVSSFFTRQSRSTYFAYFIENTILSGAGVDTTIKWRNKNGTYSYFYINTCFIGNAI